MKWLPFDFLNDVVLLVAAFKGKGVTAAPQTLVAQMGPHTYEKNQKHLLFKKDRKKGRKWVKSDFG